MSKLSSFGSAAGFATLFAGAVAAQDISTFGDGVEGSYRVGQCPDVVVVDIPFCTDECGQFLRQERAAAVAEAFAKADINRDGTTLAYVTGSASRLSPSEHNQDLTDGRVAFASRLARNEGARVVYTASYGETRASGTEVADFDEDRYARIFFTEVAGNIVQTPDGGIRPRDGLRVIGYSAPACSGHLRTGPNQ